MSVEALLILLICATIGLGWHQTRRPDSGPVTHWVAGWVAAGAGAILLVVRDEFSTGCGAGSMAERMGAFGVAGFVRKPYEPEEILTQIDRALAQQG